MSAFTVIGPALLTLVLIVSAVVGFAMMLSDHRGLPILGFFMIALSVFFILTTIKIHQGSAFYEAKEACLDSVPAATHKCVAEWRAVEKETSND